MSEQNWAGNYTYRAADWRRPTSVDELQAAVGAADRIGVIGSRHSFNGLGDADTVIDLTALPTWMHHVEGSDEVAVAAHMTYAEVAAALAPHGLALANLASLPHISVAGAVATGTHGSGSRNGNLSTAVRGLRVVRADGALVGVAADDLAGSVVAMGLLGVVESVTLAVEPAYEVAQVVYDDLTWDTVTTSFETLFDSAYSVSVFSRYGERPEQVWLKFRADDARLHDHRSGTALAGAARATVELHPIRSMSAEATTAQLGQPGRWDERLPHFRAAFQPSAGEEIQTEFFVDLRDGAAALEALRGIAPALDDVLLVSEIRTVAADALWMSPTYGRHSAAFHFTWRRDPPPSIGQSASSRMRLAPLRLGLTGERSSIHRRSMWRRPMSEPATSVAGGRRSIRKVASPMRGRRPRWAGDPRRSVVNRVAERRRRRPSARRW